MLWKLEPSSHFIGCKRKVLGTVPFGYKVYFLIGSLTRCRVRDQKPTKVSPGPWRTLSAVAKNARGIWLSSWASAANMPFQSQLPQHNLRWKFSDQNFSYKSRNLVGPIARPGSPLPSPRPFQLLDKQAFELLIWMPWSRHWHVLKSQNTPSSLVDFEKISLLTIFSCAYKSSCLSLCLPESLLTDLQATQAGLWGPHHLSH